MTAQLLITIVVAVMAFVGIGFAVVIWMLRDYALKYKKAVAGLCKTEAKRDKRLAVPRLGSAVRFYDSSGLAHDALVTAIHSRGVNLILISKDDTVNDGFGRALYRAISVPHKSTTGNSRYYFTYLDEEINRQHSGAEDVRYGAVEAITGEA